jgi:DNA polymerase I-like protein with 3'-5' exonuclease and polymerase domains
LEGIISERLSTVRQMVAAPTYNPSSPAQTSRLFAALGSRDITSTAKASRDKVASRHPLNKLILNRIGKFREDRKLLSSYTKESIFFPGSNNVLYSLNPHGTDTSRLASREHHFWYGLQIQNIPIDKKESLSIKQMFVPPPNFKLGEVDRAQAETRDTAYISGDTKLLAAVESDKDFHSLNTSLFFGIPYEKIVDNKGKVIDTERRWLTKRVSHGLDNNLTSPKKLVDVLGIENIVQAKRLIGLPAKFSLEDTAQYLINKYVETYPISKKEFPAWVKHQVSTKLLVDAMGWTRYCFGDTSNKRDFNAYVAHYPQCLNAQELNKAWMRVFYEVWLPHYEDFRLHAQIHDSILFSYRIGRLDLAHRVRECMMNPIEVTDIFGVKRIMRIPVDLKAEGDSWSSLREIK